MAYGILSSNGGGDAATVNGHTVNADVPENAKFTDTTYTAATVAPKANGTAAVGTSVKYAREDHVHPLQTSVSGNAGTAARLQTVRKINGVAFDGSADITIKAEANGGNAATVNRHTVNADVPANAKFTDTKYSVMTGATNNASGTQGLVPAPTAGKQDLFLKGDGTWDSAFNIVRQVEINAPNLNPTQTPTTAPDIIQDTMDQPFSYYQITVKHLVSRVCSHFITNSTPLLKRGEGYHLSLLGDDKSYMWCFYDNKPSINRATMADISIFSSLSSDGTTSYSIQITADWDGPVHKDVVFVNPNGGQGVTSFIITYYK